MNRRIKTKQAKRKAAEPKPTIQSSIEEVKVGAAHLATAAKEEATVRAGEAREQLEVLVNRTEAKAEKLLEKIPRIGPDAAQKLHDVTHQEPRQARRAR